MLQSPTFWGTYRFSFQLQRNVCQTDLNDGKENAANKIKVQNQSKCSFENYSLRKRIFGSRIEQQRRKMEWIHLKYDGPKSFAVE